MQINKTAYQKYYFSASLTEQQGRGVPQNMQQSRSLWKRVLPTLYHPSHWLPKHCPGDVSREETQWRWGQKGSQNVLASFLPGFPLPSAWLTKEINNAALLCPPSHALPHLPAPWMATTWSPSKSILQSPEVKHMGNKALQGVKTDHISLADGGRHGNQWRAKDIFLLFYVKCMCWNQGWQSWRTFFHWAFGFP